MTILAGCSGLTREGEPESAYIPDASYYLLMAEIAVQRNNPVVAAEQYLNAATRSNDPEMARRATEFAVEFGYESFALSSVLRWLALEPESRPAHEHAGRLYLRRYDTKHALEQFRTLLVPDEPPSDESFLELSDLLSGEDNSAGVTTLFKCLVRQYPDSAGLQLALARSALRSGDPALALFASRRAGAGRPDLLEPQLLTAQALMAQGRETAALEQIKTVRKTSYSIAADLEYVRLLSAVGRLDAASKQLADLAEVYGVQPEFVRIHALANLSAGELETAAREFRKLLTAGKYVNDCLYYLGRIAVLRGDYRDGIDYFSRIRGGSYLLPAQVVTTQAYRMLDERQAALDNLEQFARSFPRLALAVSPQRAQLLFELGEERQALDVFEELLEFRPDSVDLLLAYGAMLDRAGDTDGSLAQMRRAVELAPMDANSLNTLGYTLANRTRRHKQAYRLIRLALELEPDSPAIIDSMGWVLYRFGRNKQALSYLEQAYALLDDPEVIAHLAELLWKTGEKERARNLFERALDEHPQNKLLTELQAKLLQ